MTTTLYGCDVYLIDTDVISEARKGKRANPGVRDFLRQCADDEISIYLSVITIGEIRRGVEKIRHRGDTPQAEQLENWLQQVCTDFSEAILPSDEEMAQAWGKLRVPHPENPMDKQIAATALMHDLTVVTRNVTHFSGTGVRLLNPFSG